MPPLGGGQLHVDLPLPVRLFENENKIVRKVEKSYGHISIYAPLQRREGILFC